MLQPEEFPVALGCNIGSEVICKFHKTNLGSKPISAICFKVITEFLNLSLNSDKFLSCHRDNVFLQIALFLVLRFLDLPGLLKFPLFFLNEVGQHVTLARSHLEVRQGSVGVLVPIINVVEDQLGIQKQWHL